MDACHQQESQTEGDAVHGEDLRDRQRAGEKAEHAHHQDDAAREILRRHLVGQVGVGAVHPIQHREDQEHAADLSEGQVVGEQDGQLRDGEHEDQVEEQLQGGHPARGGLPAGGALFGRLLSAGAGVAVMVSPDVLIVGGRIHPNGEESRCTTKTEGGPPSPVDGGPRSMSGSRQPRASRSVRRCLGRRPLVGEHREVDAVPERPVRPHPVPAQNALALRAEAGDGVLRALVHVVGLPLHAAHAEVLEGVGEKQELGFGVHRERQ